jgi:cytochrome oxidase Cu insertion factor (SCO1/SenC/PrrC family)
LATGHCVMTVWHLARLPSEKSENNAMGKVTLNRPAPDFSMTDYQGKEVSLSQFKGKQNVLLVFNRGFT